MPVYHQMGHQSGNLVAEPDLGAYAGEIASPVNYTPSEMQTLCDQHRERPGFECIFDPQLYFPSSERENLRRWTHFPADFETGDSGDLQWWDPITSSMAKIARDMRMTAVCSPAYVPHAYSDDYYTMMVRVGDLMQRKVAGSRIDVLQTVVLSMADLTQPKRALAVASITSSGQCERAYVVIVPPTTTPRAEFEEPEALKGVMRFISELETAGIRVVVGYTSIDMVLWKAAGATSCATGKFFNLRRFTGSRFEPPPAGGGGQLPYWIEENLLGFLRQSDIVRVRREDLLSAASLANPFGLQILNILDTAPETAWVALGWRQFLYWFAEMEGRIARGEVDVRTLLREVEDRWQELNDRPEPLLMEEARNNGRWLRPWRRAELEYRYH
ncbi:MAG: hypothetical protein ACYCUI_14620 [Vulcanimicrobiaceae bacterium]